MLRVADGGDIGEVTAQLAHRVEQAGLEAGRMVLAGIGEAAGMALQLAVGQGGDRARTAGVRWRAGVRRCSAAAGAAGTAVRRPGPAAPGLDGGRPAVLRGGAGRPAPLLPRRRGGTRKAPCWRGTGAHPAGTTAAPAPALVRLGAAYLAELVAMALGASPGR